MYQSGTRPIHIFLGILFECIFLQFSGRFYGGGLCTFLFSNIFQHFRATFREYKKQILCRTSGKSSGDSDWKSESKTCRRGNAKFPHKYLNFDNYPSEYLITAFAMVYDPYLWYKQKSFKLCNKT